MKIDDFPAIKQLIDCDKMSKKIKQISTRELTDKLANADEKTIKKLAQQYGSMEVNVALLNIAVRKKMEIPKTRGYPPGIFISYRWENEKHKEWVYRLASWLKEEGFIVFLDSFDVDLQPKNLYEVPDFISGIIQSHYLLVILSPGYIKRIDPGVENEGWVTWEYEQARKLVSNLKIKMRFTIATGKQYLDLCDEHNTVDLREYSEEFKKLQKLFFKDDSIYLDLQMRETLIIVLDHADRFLREGNYDNAYKTLTTYPGFEKIFEIQYRKMQCHAFTARGDFKKAAEIAMEIKDTAGIEPAESFTIIDVLSRDEKFTDALMKLLQLKKLMNNRITYNTKGKVSDVDIKNNYFDTYPGLIDNKQRRHCYNRLGYVLDKLSSPDAAIRHYDFALRIASKDDPSMKSSIMGSIGAIYLRKKEFTNAEKYLKKAISIDPMYKDPYGRLIMSLLSQSKNKEAEKVLRKAKKNFPNITNVITDFPNLNTGTIALNEDEKISSGKPVYTCNNCTSKFELNHREKWICGTCTTIRKTEKPPGPCRVCGNELVVPLWRLENEKEKIKIECPVCENGTLNKKVL